MNTTHTTPGALSAELLPCPFCGAVAPNVAVRTLTQINGEDDGMPDVFAVNCSFTESGCGATGQYSSRVDEAIAAWNTRTPATQTNGDAQDAARYRYLRNNEIHTYGEEDFELRFRYGHLFNETLDKAIDAAISAAHHARKPKEK